MTAPLGDTSPASSPARTATQRLFVRFAALAGTWCLVWMLVAGWLGSWFMPGSDTARLLGGVIGLLIASGWLAVGCMAMARRLGHGDGAGLAAWAGAEPVSAGFDRGQVQQLDPQESRLVEAAHGVAQRLGMPRPKTWVWPAEAHIDATAFGWTPASAVLLLTRGALDRLAEAELRAVVAHQLLHVDAGHARLRMAALAMVNGFAWVQVTGNSIRERDPASGEPATSLRRMLGAALAGAGALAAPWRRALEVLATRGHEHHVDDRLREGAPDLQVALATAVRKIWYDAQQEQAAGRTVPQGARAEALAPYGFARVAASARGRVRALAARAAQLSGGATSPLPSGLLALAPDLVDPADATGAGFDAPALGSREEPNGYMPEPVLLDQWLGVTAGGSDLPAAPANAAEASARDPMALPVAAALAHPDAGSDALADAAGVATGLAAAVPPGPFSDEPTQRPEHEPAISAASLPDPSPSAETEPADAHALANPSGDIGARLDALLDAREPALAAVTGPEVVTAAAVGPLMDPAAATLAEPEIDLPSSQPPGKDMSAATALDLAAATGPQGDLPNPDGAAASARWATWRATAAAGDATQTDIESRALAALAAQVLGGPAAAAAAPSPHPPAIAVDAGPVAADEPMSGGQRPAAWARAVQRLVGGDSRTSNRFATLLPPNPAIDSAEAQALAEAAARVLPAQAQIDPVEQRRQAEMTVKLEWREAERVARAALGSGSPTGAVTYPRPDEERQASRALTADDKAAAARAVVNNAFGVAPRRAPGRAGRIALPPAVGPEHAPVPAPLPALPPPPPLVDATTLSSQPQPDPQPSAVDTAATAAADLASAAPPSQLNLTIVLATPVGEPPSADHPAVPGLMPSTPPAPLDPPQITPLSPPEHQAADALAPPSAKTLASEPALAPATLLPRTRHPRSWIRRWRNRGEAASGATGDDGAVQAHPEHDNPMDLGPGENASAPTAPLLPPLAGRTGFVDVTGFGPTTGFSRGGAGLSGADEDDETPLPELPALPPLPPLPEDNDPGHGTGETASAAPVPANRMSLPTLDDTMLPAQPADRTTPRDASDTVPPNPWSEASDGFAPTQVMPLASLPDAPRPWAAEAASGQAALDFAAANPVEPSLDPPPAATPTEADEPVPAVDFTQVQLPPPSPRPVIRGRGLAPASQAAPGTPLQRLAPPDQRVSETALLTPRQLAAARLLQVPSGAALHAAILACMLTSGNDREHRAWRIETAAVSDAQSFLDDLHTQPRAAWVGWFSEWVRRAASAPLEQRRSLVEAARRVMTAAGVVKPLDRLRWLTLRHMLAGGGSHRRVLAAESHESAQAFYQANLSHIATYTAFLARVIPVYSTELGIDPLGESWYRAVLQRFIGMAPLPPCRVPDSDTLVHAVRALQELGWMHRPPLIRAWAGEAQSHSGSSGLSPEAIDALHMSCLLLDAPMPTELRRFVPPLPVRGQGNA